MVLSLRPVTPPLSRRLHCGFTSPGGATGAAPVTPPLSRRLHCGYSPSGGDDYPALVTPPLSRRLHCGFSLVHRPKKLALVSLRLFRGGSIAAMQTRSPSSRR